MAKGTWRSLGWEGLRFKAEGRLVLRHNKRLQYGYTPGFGQPLCDALHDMQAYCARHPHGNPKITGFIKVVEHCSINNMPLGDYLDRMIMMRNLEDLSVPQAAS